LSKSDVMIVGAGPAGCAAAAKALSHGLSVTIIDKFSFPRDKLCGGLVTGRSMSLLRELFSMNPADDLFLKTNHMRLCAGDRELFNKPNAPTMYMTMRREFDQTLLNHCLHRGANFVHGTASEICGTHLKLRDGREFEFKVLIGADGANSVVARIALDKPTRAARMGFGLEIEAPRSDIDDNAVELDLNAVSWGYGWSFPKHQTRTVGVGGLHGRNPDIKGLMQLYTKKMAPDASVTSQKGAFLPFGDFVEHPGRYRIILAGDAAGLVDPITGEGIALALESGAIAGDAAADAIAQRSPDKSYSIYRRRIAHIHRDLRYARLLRFFMFARITKSVSENALSKSSITDMYLGLLNGEVSYPSLTKRAIKRFPAALMSAMVRS